MWGLLRENSRLIEQFTSLAAAAGPLDNTDQLLQQVIVGFFSSQFLFRDLNQFLIDMAIQRIVRMVKGVMMSQFVIFI